MSFTYSNRVWKPKASYWWSLLTNSLELSRRQLWLWNAHIRWFEGDGVFMSWAWLSSSHFILIYLKNRKRHIRKINSGVAGRWLLWTRRRRSSITPQRALIDVKPTLLRFSRGVRTYIGSTAPWRVYSASKCEQKVFLGEQGLWQMMSSSSLTGLSRALRYNHYALMEELSDDRSQLGSMQYKCCCQKW